MSTTNLVEKIRTSSRLMVRELGFMNTTLAATNYSPSAVHSLLEIDRQGAMTAAQLAQMLGLEKSSVSRMLGRLLTAGELCETQSVEDARVKLLRLTPQGKETANRINEYGAKRVIEALQQLDAVQQQKVAQGLTAWAQALERCRTGGITAASMPRIITGFVPGAIGRIATLHGKYYADNHGFGTYFEAKVASGLAEFAGRMDHERNQIWLAVCDGEIVGSVAIDGQDLGEGQAHLRWFILDESCRGSGLGKKLLDAAVAFCDRQGFAATQLWTFKGLDAARRLYEHYGFSLAQEWQGDQWGTTLTEQQFTRSGGAAR